MVYTIHMDGHFSFGAIGLLDVFFGTGIRLVFQDCGDAMSAPHVHAVSVLDVRSSTLVESSGRGHRDDYTFVTVHGNTESIGINL